jgi:hypothetical protein
MGLIKQNYEINGYIYPEVYAVFNGNIRKLGNDHVVYFDIHGTRNLALNNQPLKTVSVRVKNWDRVCDIVKLAYRVGKEQIIEQVNDLESGELKIVLKDNTFTGWQDDIKEY